MTESAYPAGKDERCRFRPGKQGELRLVLRVTMQCDLSCPHCLSATGSCETELSTGEWLSLIGQFPDIGASKVLLTGGEPLLRADILPLVEAISAAGIRTDLNSNLHKMTRPLMRALKRAGLSEISVSLEGPEEVHDRMHGCAGAWARLVAAIRWAAEDGIPVDASCCLTGENFHLVRNLIALVCALPVRSLTFSRLLPIGHGRAHRWAVTQECLSECYRLIQQIASGGSIPIRCTGMLTAPRPEDCGRGVSLVGIASDGALLGCPLACDNPRVPHPLEIGLAPAWLMLRNELAGGQHRLCWADGDGHA